MPVGKAAEMISSAAKQTLGLSEALLKGVEPHMFARKPRWGMDGGEIPCNHAAWVYGHLAIYFPRLIAQLGGAGGVGGAGNTGAPAVPASYEALFKNGTQCHDDPAGAVYPAMEQVASTFLTGYRAAINAVERCSDADLARANTAMAPDRFPTLGAIANFLLNNHVMMHLGQVSTWRRAMGLPSAM